MVVDFQGCILPQILFCQTIFVRHFLLFHRQFLFFLRWRPVKAAVDVRPEEVSGHWGVWIPVQLNLQIPKFLDGCSIRNSVKFISSFFRILPEGLFGLGGTMFHGVEPGLCQILNLLRWRALTNKFTVGIMSCDPSFHLLDIISNQTVWFGTYQSGRSHSPIREYIVKVRPKVGYKLPWPIRLACISSFWHEPKDPKIRLLKVLDCKRVRQRVTMGNWPYWDVHGTYSVESKLVQFTMIYGTYPTYLYRGYTIQILSTMDIPIALLKIRWFELNIMQRFVFEWNPLGTWMSEEVSKWLGSNGLFHLPINGVFLGVITHWPYPFTGTSNWITWSATHTHTMFQFHFFQTHVLYLDPWSQMTHLSQEKYTLLLSFESWLFNDGILISWFMK